MERMAMSQQERDRLDWLKRARDGKMTQREVADQQKQLKVITEDQVRLRANLKEMPSTAAAYQRYLDKFDAQETQIEKYQEEIKKLQETEFKQKKELEDFIANFSAE